MTPIKNFVTKERVHLQQFLLKINRKLKQNTFVRINPLHLEIPFHEKTPFLLANQGRAAKRSRRGTLDPHLSNINPCQLIAY